jgi:hypothetical protein
MRQNNVAEKWDLQVNLLHNGFIISSGYQLRTTLDEGEKMIGTEKS